MKRLHLVNVGLNNGGDLLMAMAAVVQLQKRLGPRAVTVNGKPCDVATLRVAGATKPSPAARLARSLRRLLARDEPHFDAGELVLDCNGYRHGGIWPERNLDADLALASAIRDRGARLVLLPKSYGPFNAASGARFAELAAAAALAYVRDEESLRLCQPFTARLRLCPDFTIDLPATPVSVPQSARHGIVVVPNSKLVQTGMFPDVQGYVRFLVQCLRRLERFGQPCSVLFHQGLDARLLRAPLERQGVVTVFHDDPRAAKATLAKAWLVVASRYHGMIGALASGTRCLVLGWSHKYEGFLRFYPEGTDWLVREATPESLEQKLSWITAPEQQATLQQRIEAGNRAIPAMTQAMWDEVARLESAAGTPD